MEKQTQNTIGKETFRQKLQLRVEKTIRAWLKRLTSALSVVNASMSTIVNSVNLISRPIVAANIALGNIGISIACNSVSFILNTYSLINHFKERNLRKKFDTAKTTEEKDRDKHKLQGIYLDLLCDSLFLILTITHKYKWTYE